MPKLKIRCTGYHEPSPLLVSGSTSTSPRLSKVKRFIPCAYILKFCNPAKRIALWGSEYPISKFFRRKYDCLLYTSDAADEL